MHLEARGLTDYFNTRTRYINFYNLTDKTLITHTQLMLHIMFQESHYQTKRVSPK